MEELYEQQLAELLTDLTDRMGRGEELLLEEVCQKHPEFAVDIRDPQGEVTASLAIAGPAGDLPLDRAEAIVGVLREQARAIEAQWGERPAAPIALNVT